MREVRSSVILAVLCYGRQSRQADQEKNNRGLAENRARAPHAWSRPGKAGFPLQKRRVPLWLKFHLRMMRENAGLYDTRLS